nr:aminotransferase class IV [Prevotella sp.]
MYRFIETIRIENGNAQRLSFHQKRMDETCSHFNLEKTRICISNLIKNCPAKGTYKFRMVYGQDGVEDISCQKYTMKKIESLKIVDGGDIDYSYKYEDRSRLDLLTGMKADCDNIIISKNGLLTDTSYTNLALFDGVKWITPRNPLLNGTMRRFLLQDEKITEDDIKITDLAKFKQIALFNSMIDFGKIVLNMDAVRI